LSSSFSSDCIFANGTEGGSGLFPPAVVSSGCLHVGLYIAVSFSSKGRGLGLRLVEIEIFIQIEFSNHCSDVQRLFSVIGNDGEKQYVQKKVTISAKKMKITELVRIP
jgi:hypothetical protein